MIAGYELGLVPGSRMRSAVTRVCFWGRREADIFELGARYAETLHPLVRPDALEKIRWHQAHGDTVVVVSASLAPTCDTGAKSWRSSSSAASSKPTPEP